MQDARKQAIELYKHLRRADQKVFELIERLALPPRAKYLERQVWMKVIRERANQALGGEDE